MQPPKFSDCSVKELKMFYESAGKELLARKQKEEIEKREKSVLEKEEKKEKFLASDKYKKLKAEKKEILEEFEALSKNSKFQISIPLEINITWFDIEEILNGGHVNIDDIYHDNKITVKGDLNKKQKNIIKDFLARMNICEQIITLNPQLEAQVNNLCKRVGKFNKECEIHEIYAEDFSED